MEVLDVWMSVVKLFSSRYFSYSFFPIHTKLGTKTAKNCGTDFRNFAYKIFGNFLSASLYVSKRGAY